MNRAYRTGLLVLALLPACAVYHYEDHLPGENVVFKDSGNRQAPVEEVAESGSVSPVSSESVAAPSVAAAEPEPAPGVEENRDPNAPPAWTKKTAFDAIERSKQVYYGVGRFYYQAPTKKELDKARAQADERAILELTKIVRASTNIKGDLDGVVIQETWQDNAQMAIYSLAKYTVK